MRPRHPFLLLGLTLGIAGVVASSTPGRTEEFAKSAQIYGGGVAEEEGIHFGGWGSGMAAEDRTYKTAGDASIKIETGGYYAGARLTFVQPKDLTSQVKDPYGFLEFVIRFQPGRPKRQMQAGYGSGSGGNSGADPQFNPGGAMYGGDQQSLTPDTKKLKVVLTCDSGTFVASNFPVTLFPASEEGWFSVAIPFVAFKGIVNGNTQTIDKVDSAKLHEMRVFGDNKDTFWIGEIRTTSDDEPISVDPPEDQEVSVGEVVEFTASATGGISPLKYSWDFDLSDGIQEDATGNDVVHVFRKSSNEVPGRPGELQPKVVTLTVTDLSGAKKPVRLTANVIVNP